MLTIGAAYPRQFGAIVTLLQKNALPSEGLQRYLATTFVAQQAKRVVGCAAVELYGPVGLLRSVAVAASLRGTGLGRRLSEAACACALERGVRELYLLTTTASGFFAHLGFTLVDRSAVPPAIRETIEFARLCPASALVMVKGLY